MKLVEMPPTTAEECGSPNAASADFEFVGRHMMASYVGCNPDALRDLDALEEAMQQAVRPAVRRSSTCAARLSARWDDDRHAAFGEPRQHPYVSGAQFLLR